MLRAKKLDISKAVKDTWPTFIGANREVFRQKRGLLPSISANPYFHQESTFGMVDRLKAS